MFDAIAAGERRDVPKPFLAMLDAPELAAAIKGVGAALRFSGALREIAILASAAAVGSSYEWRCHEPIARAVGVATEVIDAAGIGVSDDPTGDPVAAAVIAFRWAAVRRRQADHTALRLVAERCGRAAASEFVANSGYYPLLALFPAASDMEGSVAQSFVAA